MSGPINRVPRGLVGLLDLAGRGQAPRVLADDVRATVELLELYLLNGRRTVAGGTSAIAAGGTWSLNLPVPANELWYVHGFSIRGTAALAAGTAYTVTPAYRPGPSGTESVGCGPVGAFTAGQFPFLSSWNRPILLPPGADLIIYATAVTLGTAQVWTCALDYTPIPI